MAPPNHAPNHTPNYTPNYTLATGPPAEVAPSTCSHPQAPSEPTEGDLENLEMLYSAIDDIFDATVKNANSAVPPKGPPVDPKTLAKPTREQQVENPVYIPTTRASIAEAPHHYHHHHTPKPLPRTKSQTEIVEIEKVQQQQQQQQRGGGSGEVRGREGLGGDRILAFEELSKNYAQLQLEVQHLKKELINAKELEGKGATSGWDS